MWPESLERGLFGDGRLSAVDALGRSSMPTGDLELAYAVVDNALFQALIYWEGRRFQALASHC